MTIDSELLHLNMQKVNQFWHRGLLVQNPSKLAELAIRLLQIETEVSEFSVYFYEEGNQPVCLSDRIRDHSRKKQKVLLFGSGTEIGWVEYIKPETHRDEDCHLISQVVDALGTMLEALKKRELLTRKILQAALLNENQHLKDLNKDLNEALTHRSSFLSKMSHEIRTL